MSSPLAHTQDLVLATRCASGEDAAASEIFRRYQGRVQALLFRIFGSNNEIDDLLQEVFIQVFRSLDGFRGDAQLSTWIHRIAVRVAYRHLARTKRHEYVPLSDRMTDIAPGPDRDFLAREGLRRFYAALAELPATGRIAFVLFEVEGLSTAEVAEHIGTSRTTAKLRIWRARKALSKLAASDPVLAEFLTTPQEAVS